MRCTRRSRAPAGARRPRAAVIVEHTSINPNKAAHIGHLRNAVLGDTFVRAAAQPRRTRRRPELHRRHRRPGGRRGGGLPAPREEDARRRRSASPGSASTTTAGTSTRSVGEFYAADPETKKLQARDAARDRGGRQRHGARWPSTSPPRIVDCHLATMVRLGIRYDLLPHESDILRLHFWDRAFELLKEIGRASASRPRARTRLLGADDGRGATARRSTRTRSSSARTAPSPTPARTSPTSSGSSARSTATSATAATARSPTASCSGRRPAARASRARRAFGHARRGLQRDRRRPVLPAARGEGGRARRSATRRAPRPATTSPTRRWCSPPPPRARSATTSQEDETRSRSRAARGSGVKADDLIDALDRQGARRDRRRATPSAIRRTRPRPTATAVAIGALRYFLLRFGRTQDHHLRHGGGARLHRRDRALRAERRGARAQHLRQARRRRATPRDALVAPAARARPRRAPAGEEGDEVWSLLLLMARSEEVVEQAVAAEDVALLAKHAFAVAQAFHSYYQKPQLLACSTPRARTRRAFRALVVDAFVRQMASCPTCSASRSRSGCDARPLDRHHARLRPTDRGDLPAARRLRRARSRRPAGCRSCCAPQRPEDAAAAARPAGRAAALRRHRRGPALYGRAPHPTLVEGAAAGATISSWRSPARPSRATCRSSLSVGAIRC